MRLALVLLCASLLAACDFTPAIEIETPVFEPSVVVRSVLVAGQVPLVRISVSQDPLVAPPEPRDRRPSATPEGAVVVLLRDGQIVETLAPRTQTCYAEARSVCNTETGRVEQTRVGPYDCSAFGGQTPVEAGATYTVRASVPGAPVAETTVTVPEAAGVVVEEAGGDAATRRLVVRVRDTPGDGTRFALTVFRRYDAYTAQVCRVGGPRDTLVVIQGGQFAYQTRFTTQDPVLLADVPIPSATLPLAPFTDAAFAGGEAALRLAVERDGSNPAARLSGELLVRVYTLSPELYQTYLSAETILSDENPFAEPAEIPGNVLGGFGVVGAQARTDVVVPAARGL